MSSTVYIETSIVSYLTARPTRDLIAASRQEIAYTWWQQEREKYQLYTSTVVIQEAAAGDSVASGKRLKVLETIPALELSLAAKTLAGLLLDGPIPKNAAEDAYHIGIAAANGIDYLLTLNFKHIANATMRYDIVSICAQAGYECPIICTPQAMLT